MIQVQDKTQPGQATRLNKFLAERLGISRRQADDLIAAGKVLVERGDDDNQTDIALVSEPKNREPAVLGARIDKNDKVWYNGSMIPFDEGFSYTYLAMNKPVGYVCSRRQQGEAPTIYGLLPEKYQDLKTVGRLDKDSSGLILLTNDGDFAFSMTHPSFVKEKVYEVELDRDLEPLHQQMIADFGVELPDGRSQLGLLRLGGGKNGGTGEFDSGVDTNKLSANDRKHWQVTMSEGRNRQIRRTFAALGYRVVRLHRKQFGKYQLSGLKPGEFVEIKKTR